MKLQRVRDLCFSRITCVPTAVSESSQRGETAIYHLHLGEIIPLFMHSLFLSVHIFPPSLSSMSAPPPPFTHTYRSPWRWKVKGGAELCFMKMQTKRSWRLPIFSPSLPHLSPFPLYFLYIFVATLPYLASSLSPLPLIPLASVSSSHSQIVKIKIDAVRQLMKSTRGQPWLTQCLPCVMT